MLAAIVLCKLAVDVLEFGGLFQIGGAGVAIGGVALMFASRQLQTEREPRFVLRKRYWLYYLLSFLQGCRRQIFITFAVFALVKVYGTGRDIIITLILINQLVVFLFSPLMGWLVDKIGGAHYVERELHRFNFYIRWLRVAEKPTSFICSLLP